LDEQGQEWAATRPLGLVSLDKSSLTKQTAFLDKNKPATPQAGLAVRLCALRLLGAVIDKKTSLNALTDNEHGHPHYLALSLRDRALMRAILGCTLRHRGIIEAHVTRLLEHPLPPNAHSLSHLLHITAAQILYLNVADYAAIDLAVTIAKNDPRLSRFASLVNAITRAFVREREEILAQNDMQTHAPAWFVTMLERAYGQDKTTTILDTIRHEPPLDITVKADTPKWARDLSAHLLPNGSLRLDRLEQPLTEMPGFAQGAWWVQDVAASLPAMLMGDIKGKRVADLCAAPGGKTAQLANLGAHVHAIDISANRLKRLNLNMKRLDLPVDAHLADIKNYAPEQKFDAVLLDVPCSATGTIRRHPDILWTKSPQDIEKLARLQQQLLTHALNLTRAGGVVVFANCSLSPKEGEDLVDNFIQHNHQATLSPIQANELPESFACLITAQGFLRTTPADLPHYNPRLAGMDGFFAARLIKC